MNPELKAKWIADLRANPDLQGRESLQDDDRKFCCLGRLCEVIGLPFDEHHWRYYTKADYENLLEDAREAYGFNDNLPIEVLEEIQLGDEQESLLIEMNDNDRLSFAEIADWIEANL